MLTAGILCGISIMNYSCKGDAVLAEVPDGGPAPKLQHILFVGDSFTHGRYNPVRSYHSGGAGGSASALVFDENYGQGGARAELEDGPYGGIPGIFAELANEAGLNYDVHIEAISATSLENNFAAAADVVAQPKWNAVVLQELSLKPLPYALTGNRLSNPEKFYSSVQTIEQAVHGKAANAKVYLYETWARADLAKILSGDNASATGFNTQYAANLSALANANHDAYAQAAQQDGNIAGIAPVGDAWVNAWTAGIANPNPFNGNNTLPSLWYGIHSVNNPSISNPDYLHPSIYGAYLSGLVLFEKITGTDVRTLGANEKVAADFGISGTVATALEQIAWQTVNQQGSHS